MTQSDPLQAKPAVELAIGHRQLAALGFVLFLLLGLVASVSYVAGRSASPKPVTPMAGVNTPPAPTAGAPHQRSPEPSKSPAVEQLIVVEPAAPQASAPLAAPSPARATAAPPQPVPLPAVLTAPALEPVAPAVLAGKMFWQVVATDRARSQATCELLASKGLPTVLADGPTPELFRVLVGPLISADETARHKRGLEDAGFQPFMKKY